MNGLGDVYTAQCEKCGYQKQLFLGSGRMDCVPSYFIPTLKKKQVGKLNNAMKKGADRIVLERFASVCEKCGELFAQPVVTYYLKDNEYKLGGYCPKCSSAKSVIVNNKAPCPECKAEIAFRQVGVWD